MKNSKKIANFGWLKEINDTGVSVKAVEGMPILPAYARGMWSAFTTLSKQRTINEAGPQPIRMSEIKAYAEYYGLTAPSERRFLSMVVTELDAVYLEHHHKAREKANKKKNTKGRGQALNRRS